MSFDDPRIEWMDKEDLFIEINGKIMDNLKVEFDVGYNPIIRSNISIKRFLEILKDSDLDTLISLCDLRKKCLKK